MCISTEIEINQSINICLMRGISKRKYPKLSYFKNQEHTSLRSYVKRPPVPPAQLAAPNSSPFSHLSQLVTIRRVKVRVRVELRAKVRVS